MNCAWRALKLSAAFVATILAAPAQAGPAEKAYDRGVAAYRANDLRGALKAFEDAERRGLRDDPNLQLNLGLTHYRLEQYDRARVYFNRIRSDLRYTAVADYHLGLVAARLDEREEATRHFEAVQYLSSNTRLRNMAVIALMRMDHLALDRDPFATAAAAPRPDLYARLSSGFDSNPELLSDRSEADLTGDGAAYLDFRADLNLPLLTTVAGETYLRADAQVRQHASDTGYDQFSGEVVLRQMWRAAGWRLGASAEGGSAWLDGEAYEGIVGGGIDGRRDLRRAILTLRADSVRVTGEGVFDYLDGWRHRVGAELSRPLERLRARGNYEYEHNERLDRTDGEEFASHSPDRHGVGLSLGIPFGARATLDARLRYRASFYPEANRFMADGVRVERTRRDELASFGLRGRVRGGAAWNWLGDVQTSRNRSTIDDYDYTRHVLLLGVEWLR